MKLNSKFRTLFIVRKSLGIILILAIGLILINLSLKKKEWEILFVIIFVQIIFMFFLIKDLRKIYTINVVEDGFYKISYFKNKTEFISFKEIKNIYSEKIQGSSTDAGEITLGYFESIIITETNQKIIISPDYFDNYNEIKTIIKLNRNRIENESN